MSTSHPGQRPALVAAEILAAQALQLDTSSGELTPDAEAVIEAEAS